MTHFGKHWAGVCLAGEYTLQEYLSEAHDASDEGAFFAATNSAGEQLLIKLAPANAARREERLFMWKRTAHLQHPNLLQLWDSGADDTAAGAGCLYAVFEWPDDHLGTALSQGPLDEAEARELLLAMLGAVRYLHAQGLVHGSITPPHVLAVGNSIKLATDNLREPSDIFAFSGDIAALGALLFQTLTGREYRPGVNLSEIPEGYAVIVRNTAGAHHPEDRWRIPEILKTVPPPPPPPPVIEAPPPVPAPVVAEIVQPPPPPVAPEPLRVRPASRTLPTDDTSYVPKMPRWAWPASVAVVVGCIAWVLHTPPRKNHPDPSAAPVQKSAPAVVPRGAPPAVVHPAAPKVQASAAQKHPIETSQTRSREAAVEKPRPVETGSASRSLEGSTPARAPVDTAARAHSVEAAAPQHPPANSTGESHPVESAGVRSVWRVIAYTYNAFRDAEKKVLAINQKWPGLQAEVFAPKGKNQPPYLVALGGRMSRLEAARVLQKARTRGMPRDTFILNFSD